MVNDDQYIHEGLRMLPEEQFFDRKQEIKNLYHRISFLPEQPVQSCAFLGSRLAGTSEIIKRVYRELFNQQEKVLPFYYRFERAFFEPAAFVRDYLSVLIRQYIAFQDKDPAAMLPPVLSFQSVEKMARDRSDPGLDRILHEYDEMLHDPDKENLVRIALHAPLILAESSTGYACVILDQLHVIFQIAWKDCAPLYKLYPPVMEYRNAPHLFTGFKSLLLPKFLGQESMAGSVQCMDLPRLEGDAAMEVLSGLCAHYGVEADPHVLEQEIHRFYGTPFYMASVVRRARENQVSLTSVEEVEDLYFQEISKYDIAFYYESLLNRSFVDPFLKRDAIRILTLAPLLAGESLRIEEAARRVSLDLIRVKEIVDALILAGLLAGKYGTVAGIQDPVVTDFLRVAQRVWLGKSDLASVRREVLKGVKDVPILTELKSQEKTGQGGEEGKVSFGLVLPMVTETELVAARALEQVAERVDFPEEEIGKIRMALIEACINSFEHSDSQDGKIYITFTLDKEKLSIIVEDKGVSFDPGQVPVPNPQRPLDKAKSRGWGIELIKNLMDQVSFDQVPVGTRLRMVKYYPKNTAWKAKAV